MRRGRQRIFSAITLGVGLTLFVFALRKAGLDEVLIRIRALGVGFVLILALGGLRSSLRAIAWLLCLSPEQRVIGLFTLFKARVIGDAAGQVTPAGPFVAEPLRLATTKGKLPFADSLHSLTVETFTYTLSSCLMVLAGTLTLIGSYALDQQLQAASFFAVAVMMLVVIVATVGVVRRWAILSALGELGRKGLHLAGFSKRWKQQVAQLRRLENYVFRFYRERHKEFPLVVCCHILFHFLGVLETWLILAFLGFTPTLLAAFTLEASYRAVNMIFAFVPGRVGVDEAGTGLLAEVLGLGAPAGVMVAIVRKARVLFWTAIGLLLFAIDQSRSTQPRV